MKTIFWIIIALLLFALGMSFYSLNDDVVHVNLYFADPESRLAIVILLAFGIGVLIGYLAMLGVVFSNKREIRALKKLQKESEEELTNLRNLPLKDDTISDELAEI